MKLSILILGACLLSPNGWLTDFSQAKQTAKETNRMILLNFSGSDWCAPCIKMKKDVFEQTEFLNFAEEHLVLLRADFPRQKKNQLGSAQKDHNEKLAAKFNPGGKFPLTMLLNADEKVIYEWDGYQGKSAAEFVNEIKAKANGK